MKKHFVTFYSPGSFVSETSRMEIESWDVKKAVEMSKTIKERYGATPYGFKFSTNSREGDELDSKETASSNFYYLGGKIITLDEIVAQNDPSNSILISNMKCNNWDRVVENTNSWKTTQPLRDGDVILESKN